MANANRCALFVCQSVNGIFLSGFKCRVNCAENRADHGYESGLDHPVRGHLYAHEWELVQDAGAGCIAEHETSDDAAKCEHEGFAQDDVDDVELAGAERL